MYPRMRQPICTLDLRDIRNASQQLLCNAFLQQKRYNMIGSAYSIRNTGRKPIMLTEGQLIAYA